MSSHMTNYELCSFSKLSLTSPTSQLILILQAFRHFTYVTAHSPTLPLLPTSQLILLPFRCFTYVTAHSPTLLSLHLHHSSFSNPSIASPTSQALHLIHLTSRPWSQYQLRWKYFESNNTFFPPLPVLMEEE